MVFIKNTCQKKIMFIFASFQINIGNEANDIWHLFYQRFHKRRGEKIFWFGNKII
jgi:hypothetical protein